MKKNTDEAVSTVIALMLILAIISTCIAVYTTTYVPGLKQQSEIVHSEDVKYAFERFASDIDNIYSLQREGQFTEPLALGGGGVLLSPVRSSGTVEIENTSIGSVKIGSSDSIDISTVNITYTPSYSSWELQGFKYENGVVWITKGNKTTPSSLSLYTIADGEKRENTTLSQWLSNIYVQTDGTGNATVIIPTMYAGEANSVTGNANAILRVNASISDESMDLPDGSKLVILDSNGTTLYSYTFSGKTNLTVQWLAIRVSVE
jgi:hypothetical protein